MRLTPGDPYVHAWPAAAHRQRTRYGASAAELMEVFELASGIGVESFALALPALRDAIEG